MEKHPLHIKKPELHTSADVSKAVQRQERLKGDRVPNEPGERIEAYMSRLEKVFLHPDNVSHDWARELKFLDKFGRIKSL